MPTPTYDLIASNVLTSSASSVTFSSLPQTYRDLVVVGSFSSGATATSILLRYNNDSGSNYYRVSMFGTGSSTGSVTATDTGNIFGFSSTSSSDASIMVNQIFDYSATDKHKTTLSRRNYSIVVADATRWASTSAITSIVAVGESANIPAGSSIYIYGIAVYRDWETR